MNIKQYDISFNTTIAKFKELNEYEIGQLLRSFDDFMSERAIAGKFLVSDIQITTKENDERI